MIRRRRPVREIAFSFDSFLDVVANVVGIILRLILVAWVGAKAYKGPPMPPVPASPALEKPSPLPSPEDPLSEELERQRRQLDQAQAQLLDQVQKWQHIHRQRSLTEDELTALEARRRQAEAEASVPAPASGPAGEVRSLAEVQKRQRALLDEIEALRKAPSLKKTLRYRTPVSQPLQSEEMFFECRQGHVTLIDIGALMDDLHRGMRAKAELLRTRWEVSDVTAPVGPFRLRYVIERERGLVGGAPPDARGNFSYGVQSWTVEPLAVERGEAVDAALTPGSAFRRVIDALDPSQTAVTFWVYPDSFPMYRRLRDYLHERDVVVAGRPLPDGFPIQSSKHGTLSRGQ